MGIRLLHGEAPGGRAIRSGAFLQPAADQEAPVGLPLAGLIRSFPGTHIASTRRLLSPVQPFTTRP